MLAGCRPAVQQPGIDDEPPIFQEENKDLIQPRPVVWAGVEIDSEVQRQLIVLIGRLELVSQGIFGGRSLSYDANKHRVIAGKAYYPVTDARFPSYAHFITYLQQTYVPEIVDRLLSRQQYIDLDGLLYTYGKEYEQGVESVGAIKAEVMRMTDRIIVIGLHEQYRDRNGKVSSLTNWEQFVDSKGRWLAAPYGYEVFAWSGLEISIALQDRLVELVKQHESINYSMFQLDSLSYDYTVEVQANGRCYYLVTDDRFPHFESLRIFLRETYTEGFAAWYLGQQKYVEVDGRLYTTGGAAGSPPETLVEVTVMRVLQLEEGMIIVERERTLEHDGRVYKALRMYKFVLEDGKWLLAPYYDLG